MTATAAFLMPRVFSIPDYAATSGREAAELFNMTGEPLDDWQEWVLVNGLGENADGRWAAPTVATVIARQNGKNVIEMARELAGLFLFGERLIVHSAHEQSTSSEHFRQLVERIKQVDELSRRVKKISYGKGAESVELWSGERIMFKTRTGGGGRGYTIDLLVFDEAQKLSAEAKAALIPAMSARSVSGNMQTWYAGTAVDQLNPAHDGVELARIRERGIAGAAGIAYFEWSCEGENPDAVSDDDYNDPCFPDPANPSKDIRISQEWINHERLVELGRREYLVERCAIGDWPRTDGLLGGTMITPPQWCELEDESSVLTDPVVVAFDVAPDRSSASVAAAGLNEQGKFHVEIGQHKKGTGWLVAFLAELNERQSPLQIVCDGYGPAASMVGELRDAGVTVSLVSTSEHGQACGHLVDKVQQDELRHLGSVELAAAIAGARTRPLGDAWAWSRKNSAVDITPLVAATLAVWAAAAAGLDGELAVF